MVQNCRYPSAEYIIPRTIDTYERLHDFLIMALLTCCEPSGADRSAISLHLMGLFYLNGLKCRFCMSSKDSTVLPSTSSVYYKKRRLLHFSKFHSRASFVVKLVSSIQVLFGKPFPEMPIDRYSQNKTVLIKEEASQRFAFKVFRRLVWKHSLNFMMCTPHTCN